MQSGRTAGAVCREPGVLLKFLHRCMGLWSEDAIGPTRIKTQGRKALLQLCDVIATHQRTDLKMQQAIAEPPMCFIKAAQRLCADDAIDQQSTALLKRSDRSVKIVAEDGWITAIKRRRSDKPQSR